nr:reverse transcriptase domain-containing protein [Tanacetum cinerariifolium]
MAKELANTRLGGHDEEETNSKGKRSERREVSSDIEGEGGSEDSWEDLNTPYKRPKPTPFTTRITRFKYHERGKLPRNVKVYEGSKDPKHHLSIFSAATEQ